ncbi:Replication protein O [Nostoc sphaeroides CCNUC1]|uniref:Replication protein O n=1 Tax=Nostoc sphaeroides CCNUC1 TaxID=2653204 RepID=A0A5P8WJP3_9NOSO|nr:Replication protein O [Nostoc sphaeroides CCNUC1]
MWTWNKSPEAVFVAACKEGRKTESTQAKSAVEDWFKWARQRVVIAMSGEVVYTPDGEAVALQEMMRRYPVGE